MKLPNASYSAGYLDYSDASDDAEFLRSRLNAARDEMLASDKSNQPVYERELKTGVFTGREFMIVQNSKLITIAQAYIVRQRLYQLAIQLPTEAAFKNGKATSQLSDQTEYFISSTNRFFASFEVPEITETMDDFDRALRELQRKSTRVLTVVCSSCGDSTLPPETKSEAMLNGRAINLVTPTYPSIARSAHASGEVSVQVLIDTDGNVAAARAVKGHPLLRAAAEKAARESKFTPPLLEGKPVNVNGIIIYNFRTQ